jgi:hypothetical protein
MDSPISTFPHPVFLPSKYLLRHTLSLVEEPTSKSFRYNDATDKKKRTNWISQVSVSTVGIYVILILEILCEKNKERSDQIRIFYYSIGTMALIEYATVNKLKINAATVNKLKIRI